MSTGGRAPATAAETEVIARLSRLDRFLPLWIGLAMAAGIGLGALLPRRPRGGTYFVTGTETISFQGKRC